MSYSKNIRAALEAILFTMGEPVSVSQMAFAVGCEIKEVEETLSAMIEDYEEDDHGIKLIAIENSYQFVTKQEYYDELIEIASHPKKPVITDVMMETLSIVAYKQPVTRLDIEKIRGVNSDHAVNRLTEYGLIKEVGRMDAPGRPVLFGTTEEFLRRFGFDSAASLPQMDPVTEAEFMQEAEAEVTVKV